MLQPFDLLLPTLVAELRQLSNGKSRQPLSLSETYDVKYFSRYSNDLKSPMEAFGTAFCSGLFGAYKTMFISSNVNRRLLSHKILKAIARQEVQLVFMFFICVLKACSLLLQVVLCFEDNDVVHVNGKVDPKWDFDVITLEHVFSDLEQEDAEKSAMERIRDALMDGKPARSVTLT
ncbi:hypothetical protein NC652_028399 [Populus alba x Populus x berolinensis]|nr:hypothetical protein NC652_028399 [Populus alba x Populus x berolinensis]